jgi:amino acid transporter
MDFEKKYSITQLPSEYLLVQWTRGYKNVDVFYKDELIGSVQGSAKLLKGTSFTSNIGIITLKLSEKPITLNVIVDGYHSPINVSHPVKDLKTMSTYFWIIIAFALIAGLLEIGLFRDWNELLVITVGVNLVVFTLYLISAIFVRQGKPWAYYLGFSVFTFCTLISMIVLFGGLAWGFLLYIFMAIRIGGEVLLIINLKTANAATRHLKYKEPSIDELLDSKL